MPLLPSVRVQNILKYFGMLVLALGVTACVPVFVAIFFQEWDAAIFYTVTASISLLLGYLLNKIEGVGKVQFNEAVVVICLTYLYASVVSSIPLMGVGLSFFNAIFEVTSGMTTTGLSVISDPQTLPKTTLFGRAWLQWIGGVGIVVFSLIFLFERGGKTKKLGSLESEPDDVIGGSFSHAKGIVIVYSLITVAGILTLIPFAKNAFDAILLTFAAVSTGGFSPYPNSIIPVSSIGQVVLTVLSILCAISLPFLFKLWNHRFSMTLQGFQMFGILLLGGLGALFLGGSFQDWILGYSAQTTTGFSTLDIATLSNVKKFVLACMMMIGGGVGSTAGGIKILRILLFVIYLRTFVIHQCQTEHAFYRPRYFGRKIEDMQLQYAISLIALYGFFLALSWFLLMMSGISTIDAFFESASALSLSGLSVGVTSEELSLFPKMVLTVDMLFGRLEILAWLIFLFPKTWVGE